MEGHFEPGGAVSHASIEQMKAVLESECAIDVSKDRNFIVRYRTVLP